MTFSHLDRSLAGWLFLSFDDLMMAMMMMIMAVVYMVVDRIIHFYFFYNGVLRMAGRVG